MNAFFYLDGLCMENVSQYSHLGHTITNRLDDSEDIYSRRCNLIGQINSILLFSNLDSVVKARLMKCYCFSMYGCVLWDFNNTQVESFCKAWRKGMKRCLS